MESAILSHLPNINNFAPDDSCTAGNTKNSMLFMLSSCFEQWSGVWLVHRECLGGGNEQLCAQKDSVSEGQRTKGESGGV